MAFMFNLIAHLYRAKAFSERAFGPMDIENPRTKGVLDHIRKECVEVEKSPFDIEEWVDIAILAMDGAMRHGATPEEFARVLDAKLTKNENRKWPDWRTAPPDKAIEHVRD